VYGFESLLGNEFQISAWRVREAAVFHLEVLKRGGAMLCNVILAFLISYLPCNFTGKAEEKVN
jgi:hypothetical protein